MAGHDIYENSIFDSMIYEAVTQVQETNDEFIFRTISNYASENFQIAIDKHELIEAILLIRSYKEHGYDISERWVTATQQSSALSREYNRGFKDGVEKEHDRVLELLDILEEENL